MRMLHVAMEERVWPLVCMSITVNVLRIGSVTSVNVRKKGLLTKFATHLLQSFISCDVGYVI